MSKLLLLIDDGWRVEKRNILRELSKKLSFDVVTHDRQTAEVLGPLFSTRLLSRHRPFRYGLYGLRVFLTKDLDTNLVRYRQRLHAFERPWPERWLLQVREGLGRLGFRRRTMFEALEQVYAGSRKYGDLLRDYDTLLFMPTSIRDKRVVFEAKARGMRVICWLYSWDNALKDNEFITDADFYLVWNRQTGVDMCRVHGVPAEKMVVVGPAQMDGLGVPENVKMKRRDTPTVLYACACGLPAHVRQEVKLILHIREILDRVCPEADLWVRPYPYRLKMEGYEPLESAKGVTFLEIGREEEGRVIQDEEAIRERMRQIASAHCLVNLGSTIALEGSLTDTPLVQLAYAPNTDEPDPLRLHHALRNEQLRYLVLPEYPNTVADPGALAVVLADILRGITEPYRDYSRVLRRFIDPLDRGVYIPRLCEVLTSLHLQGTLPE